eukprot:g886.t1
MAGFVGKVVGWIADKLIVETLAESRTFQKAVLKSADTLQKGRTEAAKAAGEVSNSGLFQTVRGAVKEAGEIKQTLKQEIRDEMKKMK